MKDSRLYKLFNRVMNDTGTGAPGRASKKLETPFFKERPDMEATMREFVKETFSDLSKAAEKEAEEAKVTEPVTIEDQWLLTMAEDCGFNWAEDEEKYLCTERQLVDFAVLCMQEGREDVITAMIDEFMDADED